jgi:hypothetical protein
MAIEQFGQSLLAGQRQRQQRIAKQQRRAQRDVALGTIAGAVGKNILQSAADNFMQSEPIRAEKRAFRNAVANADIYKRTQEAIDNSGQSAVDYFASINRTQFEQLAKEELNKRGEYELIGEAGAFNSLVTQQVREFAQEQADAQAKGYALASSLASQEDFDSMIGLSKKSARPQNLLDAGISFLKRKVSGKTKQEIDKEAYDAIINSDIMQNADRLNLFMDEYRNTKNLVGSYDYSTFIVPEIEDDDKYLVTTSAQVSAAGGVLIQSKKQTFTNRNTGNVDDEKITDLKVDFNKLKDPAEVEKETLAALDSNFNFGKDAFNQLNPKAYQRFQQELKEKHGIETTKIDTVAKYATAAKEYSNFLTANPTEIRDTVRDSIAIQMFDVLGEDALKIDGLIAQLAEQGIEKDELFRQLADRISFTMNMSQQMANEARKSSSFND